jgi:hypothetical protein
MRLHERSVEHLIGADDIRAEKKVDYGKKTGSY